MRPILFDVDGVLVHGWHTDPAKRICWDQTIEEDLGINREKFQTFFGPSFEKEIISGQRGLEDALDSFLPTIGYYGGARSVIDYWLPRDGVVNKPLWDIVARLRSTGKVKLYAASNQEHLRAAYLWNEIGLKNLFDALFYAADLGAIKPQQMFFKRCEVRMNLKDGEQPLFFDDFDVYVAGARRAGWEAHIYENEESCLSHPTIRSLID